MFKNIFEFFKNFSRKYNSNKKGKNREEQDNFRPNEYSININDNNYSEYINHHDDLIYYYPFYPFYSSYTESYT